MGIYQINKGWPLNTMLPIQLHGLTFIYHSRFLHGVGNLIDFYSFFLNLSSRLLRKMQRIYKKRARTIWQYVNRHVPCYIEIVLLNRVYIYNKVKTEKNKWIQKLPTKIDGHYHPIHTTATWNFLKKMNLYLILTSQYSTSEGGKGQVSQAKIQPN